MSCLAGPSQQLIQDLSSYRPLNSLSLTTSSSSSSSQADSFNAKRSEQLDANKAISLDGDPLENIDHDSEHLQEIIEAYIINLMRKHASPVDRNNIPDSELEFKLIIKIQALQSRLANIHPQIAECQAEIKPILMKLTSTLSREKAREALSESSLAKLSAAEEQVQSLKRRRDTLKGVLRGLILTVYPNWAETPDLVEILLLCGDDDDDLDADIGEDANGNEDGMSE